MLGPVGKGQVFLVSEPEAMFRSWIHDGADPQEFKVGVSPVGTTMYHDTKIMGIRLGGDTWLWTGEVAHA
jgi:hypothetical protein